MQFTQHVVINVADEASLMALMQEWNESDADAAPGYLGGRLLRFRDKPGRYVIQADFESWDDAQDNNERPETNEWARRLVEIIDGDPKYENLDVLGTF